MQETLLLLHGALGSSAQMLPLRIFFDNEYNVLNPDLPGHGSKVDEDNFNINGFEDALIKTIEGTGNAVHIFGYSMGGYVALKLAADRPDLVKSIITLGTRLHWNPEVAEGECKMLNPEKVLEKVPAFAEELKARHGNWEKVMFRTAALLREIGSTNPLRNEHFYNISCPAFLMLGDRDKMVSLEETVRAYRMLSSGQMAVLPGTPHPFEKSDVNLVHFFIKRFIGRLN